MIILTEEDGWPHIIQHNDIQHNDIQHNDIQHNDIQHNDIQHNDIQHNDIQHNDTLNNGLKCDSQRIKDTQNNIVLNVEFELLSSESLF
jgi:hypothetical protein